MIKSESIAKLTVALIAAKKDFAPVLKQSENPGFKKDGKPSKYADLENAIDATEAPLLANGLVIMQFPVNEGDRIGVLTMLIHNSGEYIGKEFTLPLARQDAQTGVAAITYARRASRLGILDVAAEDDDGNTAAGRDVEHKNPKQTIQNTEQLPPTAYAPLAEVGSAGDQLPSKEQLDKYRQQVVDLTKELVDSGELKTTRGLRSGIKVITYVLKLAGFSNDVIGQARNEDNGVTKLAEKITAVQWEKLFSNINTTKSGTNGLKELAAQIEAVRGE